MKTIKVICTILLAGMLIAGYLIKQNQVITQLDIINLKLERADLNDSITNDRITDLNRKFYSQYSLISKEDKCKVVSDHIDKKHSPNHLTCKHYKK